MLSSPDDSENPLASLLQKKASIFHQTDKQDDNHDPPFFLNFPSPFFDEQELPLNRILHHHDPITAPAEKSQQQNKINIGLITKKETVKRDLKPTKLKEKTDKDQTSKRQNTGAVSRKNTGKKDRHSKICTAQGIRDRRMRLSLEIARKFFDLQDMLGYDKASRTIEWLFSKSNKAIKELMKERKCYNFSASDGKTDSFLSECEVVSGINEVSSTNEIINDHSGYIFPNNEKNSRKNAGKPNNNLKESREKARARARWRTREKMMVKRLDNSGLLWANVPASPNFQNDGDLQKLGFFNSSFEGIIDQELSPDAGTIEKLLGNSSLSTSSVYPISDNYNYHYCIDPNSTFMGVLGNWELLSNLERCNSSQFTVTNQGNSNISVHFSGATSDFPLFHQ